VISPGRALRQASTLADRPAVSFPAAGPIQAAIAAIGASVPATIVDNEAVAERLGVSVDWIVSRTGVSERRIARDDERLTDLAAEAGTLALERAGVAGSDLDLVIVATIASDELLPNAAPLVAERLGAARAGAMDVGAACTGFLSGLAVAAGYVESGRAERVLVIAADLLSRLTDPADRATAALFADGAGAALVAPSGGAGGLGRIVLHADAGGVSSIRAGHYDRVIRMQGHDTFRDAVRCLSEATLEAADVAGLSLLEIDLFVYHQANSRILAAVAERLQLDRSRVVDCIDRYGNTSAATIPIALTEAEADGLLVPGALVLMAACGAGFTWGAGVAEWV
jgi:3-oxoacyl-[acyl-carrier-protein] synthase III